MRSLERIQIGPLGQVFAFDRLTHGRPGRRIGQHAPKRQAALERYLAGR